MKGRKKSTRVVVITEDGAFFSAVAERIRRGERAAADGFGAAGVVLRGPSDPLSPVVDLGDLLIVDARGIGRPVGEINALPCRKVFLNGAGPKAMGELDTILARVFRGHGSGTERAGRDRASPEPGAPAGERTGRSSLEREKALLSFAGRLATLKPEKINQACLAFLPGILGADRASGYLFDPGGNRLELAWSTREADVLRTIDVSPFRDDSIMALAVNRRETWFADDADKELTAMGLALDRPFAGRYRTGSCVVVPVVFGAELVGVLNFADPVHGASFDRDKIGPLVEGVSHLLAATWQNVSAVSSLEQLARTDGLSGLANYRAFEESLGQEVVRSRRYGSPLSLILMDVDNLKTVNDRYGHPAGDLLLREVARRIAEAVRETDVPARHGGDEFSVILPSTDEGAARQVAERVAAAVNGAEVCWDRHTFQSSVSMACGQYDGVSSPSRFLSAIDEELYSHKRGEASNLRTHHI